MPYLNRIIDKAVYNHHSKTLTLKMNGLVTLHPTEIAAGQVKDEKTVYEICE